MKPAPAIAFLLPAALLLAGTLDAQTTRRVPEQYSSIQSAINASVNQDIVDVGPGRYVGFLDFKGKAILVKGRAGASSTILDNVRMGSVVVFNRSEGPDAVLEGFTVRGGSTQYGGGIYISGASPTIRACIIVDNHAFEGGGLYTLNSQATIEGCFFYDNWAFHTGGLGGLGAAIFCENSDLTLNHVSATRNNADYTADGMFIAGGNPALTNCIFHTGADIHVTSTAAPVLNHCVLDGLWPGAGTGNLWVDPKFVDSGFWNPHHPDMHLRIDSPCRDAGMVIVADGEIDGDPRDATPDIGADEYLESSHWYNGNPVSGGILRFNASGRPGDQIFWLVAGSVMPAPVHTVFGDLILDPSLLFFIMGPVGSGGVLSYDAHIPWISSNLTFYSQVLVGTVPGFEFSLPRHALILGS